MRAILSVLFLFIVGPTAAAPAKIITTVVIGPAKISIAPTPFKPGDQLTIHTTFHQGAAFAPIPAGLGCPTPGSSGPTGCDNSRSLGVAAWRESATLVRSTQPLDGVSVDFNPPPYYTVVDQTFSPFAAPSVEPGEYLVLEVIFYDKLLKPYGNIGLTAVDFPRVLGSKRFKWLCRAKNTQCRYVEVPS
jgi:hypothetical protein